jgi:hypothetical protein
MKEKAMINKVIKPCPFCGSSASVGIRNGFYKVICNNPECSTRYNGWLSKDRAIKEWNTRRKGKKND